MTDSALHSPPTDTAPDRLDPVVRVRRLAWKLAVATALLMAVGAATRVTNAGLACPDWPLCYGQLLPAAQMNLQVFLEWFHRLDASIIGLLAILLCGRCWQFRAFLPAGLPLAATGALLLVVLQGALGGLTVTELLRFDIVTAHLGTALLFFGCVLAIGTLLLPYRPTGTARNLREVGTLSAILVYLQCLLGGLVASRWAVHQCLSGGQLCEVMHGHMLGIVPPTFAVLVLAIGAWRTPALHPSLRGLAKGAIALVACQMLLGVGTLHLHLQVEWLTVAHHTVGALLFGTLIVFSVLAWRDSLAVKRESNHGTTGGFGIDRSVSTVRF